MARKKLVVPSDPMSFGKFAKKKRHKPPQSGHGSHSHGHVSTRHDEYKGFAIEIETAYKIVNSRSNSQGLNDQSLMY